MRTLYTKIHFGKSLEEDITAEDVINYFASERDESLTLEFKSYYAKEKPNFDGVLRTIAAFLNSEGGLLIFGAPPEVTVREKYRVVKGNPTPISTLITTKDDLVRRISDNISYMPIGILIKPVEMSDGSFVYLIEVQESSNKPHQFKISKQYPIRLDGQSIGAPHYLVEALFKQVKRPELKGFLRVVSYRILMNPTEPFNRIALRFEVTVFNVSTAINDTDVYFQISAEIGAFIIGSDSRIRYDNDGRRLTVLNTGALITDSLPTKYKLDFQLTTEELNNLNSETFGLRMVFGSKNSTTKYSHYTINPRPQVRLSPSEVGREFTESKDLKRLIEIQKEENVSLAEKWQGNEEDRIELGLNGV